MKRFVQPVGAINANFTICGFVSKYASASFVMCYASQHLKLPYSFSGNDPSLTWNYLRK